MTNKVKEIREFTGDKLNKAEWKEIFDLFTQPMYWENSKPHVLLEAFHENGNKALTVENIAQLLNLKHFPITWPEDRFNRILRNAKLPYRLQRLERYQGCRIPWGKTHFVISRCLAKVG